MIQNDWKVAYAFFYERGFNKPSLRLNYFSLIAEGGSFKLGLRSLTGQVEGEEREEICIVVKCVGTDLQNKMETVRESQYLFCHA